MAEQLDSIEGLTSDQIAAAYKAGKLDKLLGKYSGDEGTRRELESWLLARREAGEPITSDSLATLRIPRELRASIARAARQAGDDDALRQVAADGARRIAEARSSDRIRDAFDSYLELGGA